MSTNEGLDFSESTLMISNFISLSVWYYKSLIILDLPLSFKTTKIYKNDEILYVV